MEALTEGFHPNASGDHPFLIHETAQQLTPAPAVQETPYNENVCTFGSDSAAPPPGHEEAVRRSLRAYRNEIVVAPHHVEKIRGLVPANALQVLAAEPSVAHRRIQLDQVEIARQLPTTTRQTGSFVGRCNGQQILLKRLANVIAVEDLAFEIQRRAHVGHPNLVQFIGAGWTSAHDLDLVVEFLPRGTLRRYLDQTKESFKSWTSQKTAIAGGIARALAYLHSQKPAYVHREICAKNVLLTDNLESKLVSCGSIETNMTVGAKQASRQSFWAAPEVLHGAPYSPAADIYSFGVLLPELDTCNTPYVDARSQSGDGMDLVGFLTLVKEGRLRQSFSASSPNFIRRLGVACCQQDPENRLTAQQIVQLLEGK